MKGIQYIKHDNIDIKKWDQCLENAPNALIYATSWYLDLVSPAWDAIIYGDYEAVFPLCVRSKMSLPYIAHPLFAQQLGIFGKLSEEIGINDFIKQIPNKFLKVHFQLNRYQTDDLHSTIEARRNSLLHLSSQLDVEGKMNQNTKRNIKKFKANNLTISDTINVEEFVSLKMSNSSFQLKEKEWLTMKRIVNDLIDRDCGEIIGIYVDKQLVSATFFAHWSDRIYYLFSTSSPHGKDLRAAFGIVDHVIRKYTGRGKILDFEGSMNENISRFFHGFGAELETYYVYKKGILV